jgi:hypothetical protein
LPRADRNAIEKAHHRVDTGVVARRENPGRVRGHGVADAPVRPGVAAAHHRTYVDPILNSYLPAPGAPKISETILRDQTKRAIWRAAALGGHTRERIGEMIGYRPRTVGNLVPQMYSDLTLLDAGLPESEAPMVDVVSYASKNWELFLDDTLRTRYP